MEYLLLIYAEESKMEAMSKAEREALYAEYRTFNEDLHEAGVYRDARRLQMTASATTQRARGNED